MWATLELNQKCAMPTFLAAGAELCHGPFQGAIKINDV
jgi:hypothetical protein